MMKDHLQLGNCRLSALMEEVQSVILEENNFAFQEQEKACLLSPDRKKYIQVLEESFQKNNSDFENGIHFIKCGYIFRIVEIYQKVSSLSNFGSQFGTS